MLIFNNARLRALLSESLLLAVALIAAVVGTLLLAIDISNAALFYLGFCIVWVVGTLLLLSCLSFRAWRVLTSLCLRSLSSQPNDANDGALAVLQDARLAEPDLDGTHHQRRLRFANRCVCCLCH
jgi:hypothetical protein